MLKSIRQITAIVLVFTFCAQNIIFADTIFSVNNQRLSPPPISASASPTEKFKTAKDANISKANALALALFVGKYILIDGKDPELLSHVVRDRFRNDLPALIGLSLEDVTVANGIAHIPYGEDHEIRVCKTESLSNPSFDSSKWNIVDDLAAQKVRISTGSASRLPGQKKHSGYAISLTGIMMNEREAKESGNRIKRLIAAGKARTLFTSGGRRLSDDVNIEADDTDAPFYTALRDLKDRILSYRVDEEREHSDWLPDLQVILLDDELNELSPYIVLHPGNRREQAYIPRSYLDTLSSIYNDLTEEEQEKVLSIVLEAFQHEVEHMRQLRFPIVTRTIPSESDIDSVAPSFRARALFRILHAINKTRLISEPQESAAIIKKFLEQLKLHNDEKASYIYGFMNRPAEFHLTMARKLLERERSRINIVLAQHHLGSIFGTCDIASKNFLDAKDMLLKYKAIDEGPETRRSFPVWKFIRELMRKYYLVIGTSPVIEMNVKVRDLSDNYSFKRGNEKRPGDSVLYPKESGVTAIPVDGTTVAAHIMKIPELDDHAKAQMILELKTGHDREGKAFTIISYDTLKKIGKPLLDQCTICISAGGLGTRYASIKYDNDGLKIVLDLAKAVYEIPVDGSRSILEVGIAQIYGLNHVNGTNIEINLYSSHFTDSDIIKELVRLGYAEKRTPRQLHTGIFMPPKHERDNGAPVVHLIRTRKAYLNDTRSGDFLINLDASVEGTTDGFWPDAHDSAFIDYITSGRAYESIRDGNRYKFTRNIDNEMVPDEIILAIMKLTGAAIINEGPENMGDVGGLIGKTYNPVTNESGISILEKDELAPDLLAHLTQNRKDLMRYFPLFNAANYTEDTVELVRSIFRPGATDEEILEWLREFYEARKDPERLAELRFRAEYKYRLETQRWEPDKRYPDALQPSNLAGAWFNLVSPDKKLVVEVPAKTDSSTRFEPLKENIDNFKYEREFVRFLIQTNSSDAPLASVVLPANLATKLNKGQLEGLNIKYMKNQFTLGELLAYLDNNISAIEASLKRIMDKGRRIYMPRRGSKSERVVYGSPAKCLKMFYDNFRGRSLTFISVVAHRPKEDGTGLSYSATTVRKELEILEYLGLVYVDRNERAFKYRLIPALSSVGADWVAQMCDELNFYDIPDARKPLLEEKIWGIMHEAISSYESVNAQSEAIHKMDVDLIPALPENKTLLHIIPESLIPRGGAYNNYNQRANIIEFIKRMNDIPDTREKIRIVPGNKDLAAVVQSVIAEDANVIVDVAVTDESCIDNLPDGVKMLVFKPEDSTQEENFIQLEGILASLRALHINDYEKRMSALSALYELLTGKVAPQIPPTYDTKEFARRFPIRLPPITVKQFNDLKELNENLMRLMEAA